MLDNLEFLDSVIKEEDLFGTPQFQTPNKATGQAANKEETPFQTPYVASEEKQELEVWLRLNSSVQALSSIKTNKSSIGMLIMEYDGRILHFNENAFVMLNIPFESQGPINFFEILSP